MAAFLLSTDAFYPDLAILLARVGIGLCFVIHGLGKLGFVGPGNMQGFAGWLKSMGIPYAELQARMAMLTELIGGSLIALGLLTRIGLLGCCFTMLIAAAIGHKGGGYLITNNPPGREYALNLALVCVVLFLLGPGAYSFDAYFFG